MKKDNSKINETASRYIQQIAEVSMKKKPLVAIRCITYNHERYLRDTLEGFVMQQTNFPFVAIVHDDDSADGTAEVLREYAEKYPDIILPIFETENQYSKYDGSFKRITTEACIVPGAKYIAYCEGDDYWIDPLKLQKQVDFLESHFDYGMTYGKVRYFIQKNNEFGIEFGRKCDELTSLIIKNPIPTPTVVLRKDIFEDFMIETRGQEWLVGDYPLWIYAMAHSKIYFFDECLAVYRVLSESASHFGTLQSAIKFRQSIFEMQTYFNDKYSIINQKELEYSFYNGLHRLSIERGSREDELKYYKCLKEPKIKARIRHLFVILGFKFVLKYIK